MNIYRNAIARLLTISEEGYLPIFKEESNKDNTMSKIKIADLIGPNNLDLLKEENARVGSANETSANTYISIVAIDSDLALANGVSYWVRYNSTNTSTITLNINGLGAKSVLKYGNVPLAASDLVMGHYYEHIYNGTAFEITLETNKVVKEYLTASGTNTYTSNLELDYGIYVNAMYPVKFTNANTGPATLNLNGLGAKNIYTSSGAALSSGDILANSTRILVYNGADFILFGNVSTAVTPSALTKVNDTNVTLTLGGTPSASLLQAVSLTLGWTGQLAASKGGLGIDTSALSGYGKVTAGTWSVISAATLKSDLSLNLVENTALSTWAGSTNITTLGTITTGVWQGTAIADSYISSAATWNAKLTSVLTSANFFVGNVSNVATGVAMSGDATLANTGAVTLASTAVTPGTYGDASNIPYFTVDAKGRVTSAGSNALAAGNIYTQDGTSTSAARVIKTYGNTSSEYYSFQTLAGNDIMRAMGDRTVRFGIGSNCYFDTAFTVPILSFYNVGNDVIRMYDYYTGNLDVSFGIGGGQGFLILKYATYEGVELQGLTQSFIGKGENNYGLTVGSATRMASEIFGVKGSSYFNGIIHKVKGANIASAANLTLTTNSHIITGTTTINALTIAPYVAGDHITLVFSGATTVKHNTAGGAGTAVFKLAGSVDFVTAADTVLGLYYDGTVFQQTFEKHA